MKNSLLVAMINKDIVRLGTKITTMRQCVAMDNTTFVTKDVVEVDETTVKKGVGYLLVHSTDDKQQFVVQAEHIILIDGMYPDNETAKKEIGENRGLASIYGMKDNGMPKKRGKKRGPRAKNIELLE